MMSCLTLMPVISSKALVSVFDSYSCVVMVSETTEISFTPLACSFLAASMNHFISSICLSLDKVEGWNSLSIHFLASASPAYAPWPMTKAAAAKAMAFTRNFILCLLKSFPSSIRQAGWEGMAGCLFPKELPFAQDQCENQHRHHETDPDRRLLVQRKPGDHLFAHRHEREVHVGGAQEADEQTIAARRLHRQESFADHGGRLDLQHRHHDQHQHDAGEEHRHRQRPGHPLEHVMHSRESFTTRGPSRSPSRCSAAQTRSRSRPEQSSARPPPPARPSPCRSH